MFVGIAVQPSIIVDDVIASNNSKLVEITIQICKGDEADDHTVMLSQKQAEELESIISRAKAKLDAAKTLEETSTIFSDTVASLYELGMLSKDMSIDYIQRLVKGIDQNPRIIKKLDRWVSLNQEKEVPVENYLCLIAGHTDKTLFIGPLVILSLIFLLVIGTPLVPFYDSLLSRIFEISQFIPLAFGNLIRLGDDGGPFGAQRPADGWIFAIGLNGIKNWNSFYGWILGFTGLKICFPYKEVWTQFYMGTALIINK